MARARSCQWAGIVEPVGSIGDERPRPDVSNARCKRIDIAVGPVRQRDLLRKPVLGKAVIAARQMPVEGGDEFGVALPRYFAIVGDLADLPQELDAGWSCGDRCHLTIGAQRFKSGNVIGGTGPGEALLARQLPAVNRANSRAS